MSVIVTQNVLRKYQSKSAIREVIGCIINNPILLKDHKIFIDDFVESFHKVVIVGINNTFNNGISKLDSTIIEEYLKESFPTKYAIFKRNNLFLPNKYYQEIDCSDKRNAIQVS